MTAPRDPIEAPATERQRLNDEYMRGYNAASRFMDGLLAIERAAARDEGRREAVRLRAALSLARSMILAGEPMSEQASHTFDEAFAGRNLGDDTATHLSKYGCNVYHAGGPCRWQARPGRSSDPEPAPLPGAQAAEWHRYLHQEGILVEDEGEECGPWHHRVFLGAVPALQATGEPTDE